MIRAIFSIILLTCFQCFVSCNSAPKGKSIDDVSISVLSREELRAFKKYPNAYHLEAIEKSKIKEPIESRAWFKKNEEDLSDRYDLDKVVDTKYYIVSKLTHSIPYLTDKTIDFLEVLGERMEESLKEKELLPYRFVLTSVLRTQEDQKRLRKVNYNATKNESAHFYGTTFDISQTRYAKWNSRESLYTYRLRNIMARELIKLQEEGLCYVVLERREKCFHITVIQ